MELERYIAFGQQPEIWGGILLMLLLIAVFYKIKYKDRAYSYGFAKGKKFLTNHGQSLWTDLRNQSYAQRLKIFQEKVTENAAAVRLDAIAVNIHDLQKEKSKLEKEKSVIQKDLENFDKNFIKASAQFSKETWEQIEKSHHTDLRQLLQEMRKLENVQLPKEKVEPLLDNLEAELQIRSEKLDLQCKEIDRKIKLLEQEVRPLQKLNAETRDRKPEAKPSLASLRLHESWRNLVDAVDEMQGSLLKYGLFTLIIALLLVDFVVPFQYFHEYWSDRVDSVIISFFGVHFNYHHLAVILSVVIVLAILVFLELLLQDFWTKDRRNKSTVNRISFYLFWVFNAFCGVSAFYFWYQFRQNYAELDQMLMALTLPIATAAAILLKKLRKGEGFHFLFVPFKALWFLIEIPSILLIDLVLFFRRFQFAISSYYEIRKRNQTIQSYKQEVEAFYEEKDLLKSEFNDFKEQQNEKIKSVSNLKLQIQALEKMLEQKASEFTKNVELFKGIFVKEVMKVREEWKKERMEERTLFKMQAKAIPAKIDILDRQIHQLKKTNKLIREGIEGAVQKFWRKVGK